MNEFLIFILNYSIVSWNPSLSYILSFGFQLVQMSDIDPSLSRHSFVMSWLRLVDFGNVRRLRNMNIINFMAKWFANDMTNMKLISNLWNKMETHMKNDGKHGLACLPFTTGFDFPIHLSLGMASPLITRRPWKTPSKPAPRWGPCWTGRAQKKKHSTLHSVW